MVFKGGVIPGGETSSTGGQIISLELFLVWGFFFCLLRSAFIQCFNDFGNASHAVFFLAF